MKLSDSMPIALWNAVRRGAMPFRRRRALRALLVDARHPLEPDNDDRLMAFWAVLARTGLRDHQGELLDAGRRFARRMQRDPQRRAAWTHMRLRLDALEGALDAHAHFERISGHRIEPGETVTNRPAARHHVRSRNLRSPARRALPRRGMLATLAVWLVLFTWTNTTAPDPFAFEPVGQSGYAWEQVGERTRGATPLPAGGGTVTYAAALEHARSARYTWLGLFPSYDATVLGEARDMMALAIEQADGGYSVPEQAYRTLDIIDGLLAQGAR
ncbi:MAG: hypothetical protein RIE53_10855 [Rhodothermales bacterium]